MNHKYARVVDAQGYYKTCVIVLLGKDEVGTEIESIQQYTLKQGESLLMAKSPFGLLKARWNGEGWEETASEEEIAEAQAKRQAELGENHTNTTPTLSQRVDAVEDVLLSLVLGGKLHV